MFWKKKNRCQRFFTYEKKELNISGLSASLPKEAGSLTFSLGQLNIKPEFEKVSDKLQNLDLLQFTLCQEIANLDEGPKKQEIIVNIIDIKLEMMLMAQHPERYEDDLKKVDTDGDREIYEVYINTIIEIINANNWKNWTSSIFSGGQPSNWEININKLREAISYILSRSYPERYPEIKRALFNFKNVANDFLYVFDEHAEIAYYADDNDQNSGYLRTRKFYKLDQWDPKLYNELLKKYTYHCLLVEDLAIEMTRALNYIFELIKATFSPMFRVNEGLLLVEIGPFMDLSYHTVRVEYETNEKELLYQGLRDFMESRKQRSYHRGMGVSEDYFQKPY